MKVEDMGREGKLIATVLSESTGKEYEVRCDGKTWNCSCLGYRSSKSKPATCKHIKKVFNDIKESEC